jgi:hypothetical protein
MTKFVVDHTICGCGNGHDAFTAALRLARQGVKLDETDNVCPQWFLGVASAFYQIAKLFAQAKAKHKMDMAFEGAVTKEMVRELGILVSLDAEDINKKIVAAGFQNVALTTDIAKYVCEEIKAGSTDFDEIVQGPTAEYLQSIGFIQIPITKDMIEQLADFGIDVSVMQKAN